MQYSPARLSKIFSLSETPTLTKDALLIAEKEQKIPPRKITHLKKRNQKAWQDYQIPEIGEKFGFLKKNNTCLVGSVFVTKGGVLKSTLTLNLARTAALHNIKTCVIGLDMQADITNSLGHQVHIDEDSSLDQALEKLAETKGLADLFYERATLDELIVPTDLPSLFLIPETPELVGLEKSLNLKSRREYWLQSKVVNILKEHFDLILFDCPPNWNQLITNALVSSDFLWSPLECKINNFRNFKMFKSFIDDFKRDLELDFKHIFTATRFNKNRKLSREIKGWYQERIKTCTSIAVKESIQGEEAVAMNLSLSEYAPGTTASIEMNQLIHGLWEDLNLQQQNNIQAQAEKGL